MERGKFIVFEGLDGSGKTTQAGLLARFLEFQGKEVVSTSEPTGEGDAGQVIKKVLMREEMRSPRDLQELFAEDRKVHLSTVILPALDAGKIVISDRYFLSSIAFGSIGCDFEWLIGLNAEFPNPDITFFLNVLPEHCIERIYAHKRDIKLFERPEALKKAWETYQKLPERFPNIHIIDGERPIDPIFEEVKAKIAALF
ncbi:MAG: dTMP kinase [Candidatus Liptonbacteria bacterium GWB1_49_6]|uniref:Thymidylate kinase n=1 Tax=Candidatus Liptonbacteria bacterium GWB1_49_6 TaxID=1798644 RepID=A0A1G2C4U6_9BACT|nr:MAG: dTMP kinase [Candidatus Liptonbacteria bacterium GWB1_49_6]